MYLSPVHYVVNSNEDIFELIKVDLIKQLHYSKKLKIGTPQLKGKGAVTLINYALKEPIKIVATLSSSLTKLHPAVEVLAGGAKAVHELISDFNEFEKKFNKDVLQTNDEKLIEYSDAYGARRGSYLEFDLISQILSSSIESIKTGSKGEPKLKPVLIIDDIDRLDPDHIFRLLNIFSAHHSGEKNAHKFGFDHVILVADIENIQKVYYHKYGPQTEFGGYIDKFYSTEHFDFISDGLLRSYIQEHIVIDESPEFKKVLSHILALLVSENKVKIRDIVKKPQTQRFQNIVLNQLNLTSGVPRPDFVSVDVPSLEIRSIDVELLKLFWYMAKYLGSSTAVYEALGLLKDKAINLNEDVAEKMLSMIVIASLSLNGKHEPLAAFSQFHTGYGRHLYSTNLVVTCSGNSLNIQLAWNKKNTYTGGDFFAGHKMHKPQKHDGNWGFIFNELHRQYKLFRSQQTLNRVGISTV